MKKSIKRIVAICLAAVMLCGCLAGCSAESKVYKIGICQLAQHDALDAATEGFIAAVKEKLGEENVNIDFQNGSNDAATCATIATQFVANDVDLIMANATPALQAAMQATTTIPIVATSITDFATALEMSDWNGKTGINVTGTADLAPLAEQAAMVKELCPDAQTVAILYCSGEPNSKYQADIVQAELEALGLTVKVLTCADTNEIANITNQACTEADVIYIPTDNTLAHAKSTINEIAEPAGIPVIAGEEGIAKGCGVATLSISYYNIGYAAGEMAADILANGTDPGTMEIQYDSSPVKKYVAERATLFNITVPDGYEILDITEDTEE